MNKGIVKEGILGVLRLRWQSIFKNYRRRLSNKSPEEKVVFPAKDVLVGK